MRAERQAVDMPRHLQRRAIWLQAAVFAAWCVGIAGAVVFFVLWVAALVLLGGGTS